MVQLTEGLDFSLDVFWLLLLLLLYSLGVQENYSRPAGNELNI